MDTTTMTSPGPSTRIRDADLDALLQVVRGPAVSLYVEAADPGENPHAERLRIQEALGWARDATGIGELENALPEASLRRSGGDGLAFFWSPDRIATFHLPASFDRRIVIGDGFHVLPLVRLMQTPSRFWVLFLSQNDVRLWEGRRGGLRLVEDADLPRSMADALEYEFERDDPVVITRKQTRGQHGEHGRGGTMPVFHGHGVGADDTDHELRTFYRAVATGLADAVADRPGPIVLAGVKEHHTAFRDVAALDGIADQGIEGSVRDWTADRIHEAAWPIVAGLARGRVDEARRLWDSVPGEKRETDPAGVGRLAIAGRVRSLMIEEGRELPGTVDPETGEISLGSDTGEDAPPSARGPDILDALAGHVLRRRGEVLLADPDDMPVETGVAAVLR